jgi:hypothetical protein
MKFFQQLMLAPVALGLIAPTATAAELNLEGVNQYASQNKLLALLNSQMSKQLIGHIKHSAIL